MAELEFVRTYAAPRALVWDAWTDPDQIARWWGPRGVSTPREDIVLELHPGGRYRLDMVNDETGERYPATGTVLEVDPPARLVWSDDGFADGSGKGTATITFVEVDEHQTTVRVHVIADFTDEVAAGAEAGWGTMLDKLTELLETA